MLLLYFVVWFFLLRIVYDLYLLIFEVRFLRKDMKIRICMLLYGFLLDLEELLIVYEVFFLFLEGKWYVRNYILFSYRKLCKVL